MKGIATVLLLLGCSCLSLSLQAQSERDQTENGEDRLAVSDFRLPSLRESADVNDRSIGIAYANEPLLHKAMLELDAELTSQGDFRIVPVIEDNQLQSLYDLLFLHGIDAALINSDAIAFVAGSGGYATVLSVIESLASVGSETLTLVAQEQIDTINGLKDKTIALNNQSSADNLSTPLILSALGIEARYRYLSRDQIFSGLRDGTVDATLIRLRQPDYSSQLELVSKQGQQALQQLDGLNVLPIVMNDALSGVYSQATLENEQLPGLIEKGVAIPALRSEKILAAYRWQPSSPRREEQLRFTEALVKSSEALSSLPGQNVWANIDFKASIPGVRRLTTVDEVLNTLESQSLASQQAEQIRWKEQLTLQITDRSTAILDQSSVESASADDAELQRLLNEFNVFLESLKQ